MPDSNQLAINLIAAVLRGEVSTTKEFTRRMYELPRLPDASPAAKALHQAHHYVDDADIRAKDPSYEQLQTKKLTEILEALKLG
jgi:hypothetical protein